MAVSSISNTGYTAYRNTVTSSGTSASQVGKPASASPETDQNSSAIDSYGVSALSGSEPKDKVTLSGRTPEESSDTKTETDKNGKNAGTEKKKDGTEFTPSELKQIKALKSRDDEVKAHEHAHIAAGGKYVLSGASYEYQTGPDGNRYAVGGEVSIDVSKISDDPQGTIAKMQTVIRAALAPAQPSSQDRAVASQAQRLEMEAQAELVKTEGTTDKTGDSANPSGTTSPPSSSSSEKKTGINIYA